MYPSFQKLNWNVLFSDTENIRFIFAAVKDTILKRIMEEFNLWSVKHNKNLLFSVL